jgi:hypothetical protein
MQRPLPVPSTWRPSGAPHDRGPGDLPPRYSQDPGSGGRGQLPDVGNDRQNANH